ncbi:glycerol-3-phosphate dehydrogenase [Methylobacterium dankookense]|uniref:Glycerol-3-phosphate dehydrogenase n=1 Tax=Methylobacterium dankookense TaxID=560405 RepID=A0A564G1U0_9HYPH|nr:glycerol-3-phosphate dehydrogenase [Methylobacterium dankookense]GJD55828.1 D-erythritol 1-phosphate dehydrogenase [Methylobacterium dankookense]VUF14112.1 Aerobic glycerol-3-phosphate dehydrogenase [Methylobacterium dankookense]
MDGPRTTYDLAVIGGGVNGCGIARDAAGRGARVVLFEQGDLAAGTSSASTKLIHGGLRYLEQYAFRLVREALAERAVLWRNAPHIVWPLRFVLPYHRAMRPAWLLRLGLLIYDNLGGRSDLPGTETLDLRQDPAGAPLRAAFTRGFAYSDCWVEDSRLVVLNAVDAAERGADIRVRTRVERAERVGGLWHLGVAGPEGGSEIAARALVDASGPRVGRLFGGAAPAVRLVQGSHIVTKRLFAHDRAYIFQNPDRRIVFAIPYERDFTLIGTTDRDFTGDLARVEASAEEVAYLCAAASAYFRAPVTPADVVWTYSGLRPLYDDGASQAQAATRDYVLALDAPADGPPLLSVYGGKITTYRRLAESALAKLGPHLPAIRQGAGWTASAPLPGGDFPPRGYAALVARLRAGRPWLPEALAARLARAYGTRAERILAGASSLPDLGRTFGADLTEAELRYLMQVEWAHEPADVLWRRTKLGLRIGADDRAALEAFMAAQTGMDAVREEAAPQ